MRSFGVYFVILYKLFDVEIGSGDGGEFGYVFL